jgi:hypothetical protein
MSLDYAPGDTFYKEFTVQTPSTGAAVNSDSTPTVVVNKNGTDDGTVSAAATITGIDTGRYKVTFTIPTTYAPGDVINVTAVAVVSGVTGKALIATTKLGIGATRQFNGKATSNGTTTTVIDSSLASLTESLLNRIVVFQTPRLAAAQITAHTPGSSTFTFANQPLVNATITGDVYSVF